MKIRNGFVSNSSSSSFCLIGSWVDMEEEDELYKKFKEVSQDNSSIYLMEDYDGMTAVFGMDAEELLQTRTLPEAKEEAEKIIKESLGDLWEQYTEDYGVEFIYGEVQN